MKLIIAGSRTITDYDALKSAMEYMQSVHLNSLKITEIIHGGAKGVDEMAGHYAKENGLKCTVFPAEWKRYGKAAGMIRNREMLEYGDALLALWDGQSRGTLDIILKAENRSFMAWVFEVDSDSTLHVLQETIIN